MVNEFLSGEALRHAQSGLPTTLRHKNIEQQFFSLPILTALLLLTLGGLNIPISLGVKANGAITSAGNNTNVYSTRSGQLEYLVTTSGPLRVKKGDVIARIRKLDITGQNNIADIEFTKNVLRQKLALWEKRLNTLSDDEESSGQHYENLKARYASSKTDISRAQTILLEEISKLRSELNIAEKSFEKGLVSKSRVQQLRSTLAERLLQNSDLDVKLTSLDSSIANATTDQRQRQIDLEFAQNDASIQIFDLSVQLQALSDSNELSLVSPFDGEIFPRGFKTGDLVNEKTPIFHFQDTQTPIQFEVDVSSSEVGKVKNGAKTNIEIDSLPFFDHGFIKGTVTEFDGIATELIRPGESLSPSRNYRVKITPNPESLSRFALQNSIIPGMSISAHIETEKIPLWKIVFSPLLKFWLWEG